MFVSRSSVSFCPCGRTNPVVYHIQACTEGKVDVVKEVLAENPDWINEKSHQGESCLHVSGIYGQEEITALLLSKGADPNIRSSFHQGLRMHPLSWNLFHGHVGNAKLLLEGGADVNADFDHMGTQTPVTSLDIVEEILSKMSDTDERLPEFNELKDLLIKHGAMRIADLNDQEL